MYNHRRLARDYINDSSLTNFWNVVTEAKLSNIDRKIIDLRFVKGLSLQEISDETGYSIGKINNVICKTYNKISKLI